MFGSTVFIGLAETLGITLSLGPDVKKAIEPIPRNKTRKIREEETTLFLIIPEYCYIGESCIHEGVPPTIV
tara:strand:- start:571 stop:783 length:213 start_codon:yes stop_codon:yes gene_type:complete